MIDTVIARVNWPTIKNWDNDWFRDFYHKEIEVTWEDEPEKVDTRIYANHKHLGIRAYAKNNRFYSVQFSLPRLIHGDNGELIRSQDQIDKAHENLINAMEGVADVTGGIIEYSRIDLALHFHCNPKSIIAAHRNCSYPNTKKPGLKEITESSAIWNYTGRTFAFYDKGKQKLAAFGGPEKETNILRVEVRLTKNPLCKLLGGGTPPTEINFSDCYNVYRSELLAFAPHLKFPVANTKEQALAILDKNCEKIGGLTPSQIFTQHMTPPTSRRWRRRIADAHAALLDFNWADRLPEDGPPPFIDA